MHELSIAESLVDMVTATAEYQAGGRVTGVRLRLGRLSGVVADSLRFCYEIAVAGTRLEGSRLEIEELPVVVHCAQCNADRILEGVQHFGCPVCGMLTADIRQGRELELESFEIEIGEPDRPPEPERPSDGNANRRTP